MVAYIMENGKEEDDLDKVFSSGHLVLSMKVNLLPIKGKEEVR